MAIFNSIEKKKTVFNDSKWFFFFLYTPIFEHLCQIARTCSSRILLALKPLSLFPLIDTPDNPLQLVLTFRKVAFGKMDGGIDLLRGIYKVPSTQIILLQWVEDLAFRVRLIFIGIRQS